MSPVAAVITLYSSAVGGRRSAISLQGEYRPHVRVEAGELLGVVVTSATTVELLPGQTAAIELQLPYDVDYSELRPGARFSIVEGPKVVGSGEVAGVDIL